jgi:nicotinamide mononucleotide adenylyltransferase
MAKYDAAALRAARQKRLAGRQTAASAESKQSEQKSSDEKRTAAPVAAAPAAAVPDKMASPVVDPTMVPRTAAIDLLLYGEGTENPHWVVLASGRPVAEIRLEDQEEPQKIAKLFVTEKYAEGVREAAKSFDFAEVLTGVRARPYVAAVAGADAFKRIEAAAADKAKGELRKAKAALRDDALNMLNLVVVAQTKNFISDNVLKSELFSRMTEAGVTDRQAVAIIEAAYQAKAPEHFENCFKQAFKWMDLQPEALAELEEQIKGLSHRTPVIAESEEIPTARSASSHMHNVPLETRSASFSEEGDDKGALREALGFRRRMHGR